MNYAIKDGLFSNFIRIIYKDKNDKLWLASAFGFYTIDLTKEYFDFLPSPINNGSTLPVRNIKILNNEILAAFEPGFAYSYTENSKQWLQKAKGNWLKAFYLDRFNEK